MFVNHLRVDLPAQKDISAKGHSRFSSLWRELLWLVLILIAGLLPRLVFIRSFPAHPISDFLNILDFAVLLKDDWFAKHAWQWQYFSPGLPLIIATMLNFIHKSPESIGRWATAVSTGVVPILPYILWKDTFRMRTRMIAALLLALWPGQILFSSVPAQDNWIIFPTVALSVLAVRVLVTKGGGNPVLAAILYTATVAIRQEMMIALLPVTIIAVLGARADKRVRNLVVGGSIVGILFVVLILQRGIATGRYALTTEHFGNSILGSYIPGVGVGWRSPVPYLNATHPELLEQDQLGNGSDRGALNLVWQEFVRRPKFHAIRIFGSAFTNLFEMDKQIIWWSLGAEGILPRQYRKAASSLENELTPLLQVYPITVNILFAFSVLFALNQRHILKWISPIIATIILKFGLHAVVVSQPRFFLVVIALELLTFAIVTEQCFNPESRPVFFRSLALGILSTLAFYLLSINARNYVQAHDELHQLRYHFSLRTEVGRVDCTMEQGHLLFYGENEVSFELLNPDPHPLESAIALCSMNSDQSSFMRLLVYDPYLQGGFPDRIKQIVYVNGIETFRHDLAAESWTGWLEVPLGKINAGTPLQFAVEMQAIAPDPGWRWGRATSTQFRVEAVEN